MDLKKKFENFWYYYKVPVIIAVAIIYLVASVLVSKANEVHYDHSIAIISKENYPSAEEVEQIRTVFSEKYGGSFDIVIYNIALTEENQDEVILSKLDLDLRSKISEFFFIEDMETFQEATANIEFSEAVSVQDTDWLSNLGLDSFTFAIRK